MRLEISSTDRCLTFLCDPWVIEKWHVEICVDDVLLNIITDVLINIINDIFNNTINDVVINIDSAILHRILDQPCIVRNHRLKS